MSVDKKNGDTGSGPQIKERVGTSTGLAIAPPKRFRVLLLNDNVTTMDFVVEVLEKHFGKSYGEAQTIMLRIDAEGKGVVGEYSEEVAETKLARVHSEARRRGFPLRGELQEVE